MSYMPKFAENIIEMDMGGSGEGLLPNVILLPFLQE